MKPFLVMTLCGFLLVCKVATAEASPQCLAVDEITSPVFLEAGSGMNVKIRFKTMDCSLGTDYDAGASASLKFGPHPGLEVRTGKITYADRDRSTEPELARTQAMEATIEIQASKQLARTGYRIPVVLNYQAFDSTGATIYESLAFTVPVVVYPREVSQHRSNKDRIDKDQVLSAVLVIILWPVLLFECVVLGNCWDC